MAEQVKKGPASTPAEETGASKGARIFREKAAAKKLGVERKVSRAVRCINQVASIRGLNDDQKAQVADAILSAASRASIRIKTGGPAQAEFQLA